MTLLLADAASLYVRAYFGVPSSIRSPDGVPVNAVRGYLDMTATLLTRLRTQRYAACLDIDWRPEFRVAAVPSYKAHRLRPDGREDLPDELQAQVPVLLDILAALGLAVIGAPGFEADDVAATAARQAAESGEDVLVATGDRDLYALIDEAGPGRGAVRVVWTGRGVAKATVVDAAEVRQRYGVPPHAYADMAALRGDPSDGLPGVPRVGEKTAAALIARFGSVEGLLRALDAGTTEGFPAGARTAVSQSRDYLEAALTVVRPVTTVPLPPYDDRIPSGPLAPDRLAELAARWGLESSVDRMREAMRSCSPPGGPEV